MGAGSYCMTILHTFFWGVENSKTAVPFMRFQSYWHLLCSWNMHLHRSSFSPTTYSKSQNLTSLLFFLFFFCVHFVGEFICFCGFKQASLIFIVLCTYLWEAWKVSPYVYKYACYGGKLSSTYISICHLSSCWWVWLHSANFPSTVLAFSPILTLFSSRILHVFRPFSDASKSTKHTSSAPGHYILSDVNKISTCFWVISNPSGKCCLQLHPPLGSNSYKIAVRWGTSAVLYVL